MVGESKATLSTSAPRSDVRSNDNTVQNHRPTEHEPEPHHAIPVRERFDRRKFETPRHIAPVSLCDALRVREISGLGTPRKAPYLLRCDIPLSQRAHGHCVIALRQTTPRFIHQ